MVLDGFRMKNIVVCCNEFEEFDVAPTAETEFHFVTAENAEREVDAVLLENLDEDITLMFRGGDLAKRLVGMYGGKLLP